MSIVRVTSLAILATAAGLLTPAAARAHAMSAAVEVHPDAVRVVVYFEDDIPADRAAVVVTDASGGQIASGVTDERGMWSFPRPAAGEYRLTATSAGHTARVRFPVAAVPPPDAPPAFGTPRLNPAVGLSLGAGGLLGLSALVWALRRRPNRPQPPA